MAEKAFTSIENYLECFKEIEEMHAVQRSTFENAMAELDAKFGYLLEEADKGKPETSQDEIKPEPIENEAVSATASSIQPTSEIRNVEAVETKDNDHELNDEHKRCNYCTSFRGKNNAQLRRHIRLVHSGEDLSLPESAFGAGQKIWKCNYCPKLYDVNNYLAAHIKREHEHECSHKCTACNKPFQSRTAYDVHNNRHHKS